MTERKRKIIGNGLVFAAIFLAVAIYCRPVSLRDLGSWNDDAEPYAYVSYEIWRVKLQRDNWFAGSYDAAGEEQEAWDDLISSIRVCRMPFNWLGNLHPGAGAHQLIEGQAEWNLHTFPNNDTDSPVGLQYYGENRFCYSAKALNRNLPCIVLNSEEICAKIDALIAQYGETQE